MNNEWQDLPTVQDVARAQYEGWEIQYRVKGTEFGWWPGNNWYRDYIFRGRPAQSKKVTVTSECWRHPEHGGLFWRSHGNTTCKPEAYVHFPAGDITGYVEQ